MPYHNRPYELRNTRNAGHAGRLRVDPITHYAGLLRMVPPEKTRLILEVCEAKIAGGEIPQAQQADFVRAITQSGLHSHIGTDKLTVAMLADAARRRLGIQTSQP